MTIKTWMILVLALLLCLGAVSSMAETAEVTLSEDRLASLATIQKLTDYEDYNVYTMDILYDYCLENMMPVGETDSQQIVNLIMQEAIPGFSGEIQVPDFACSAFCVTDADGTVRFGRNYDFYNNTSCMIVSCHPKDGYASVAHTALNNLEADDPESSDEAKVACLAAPFMCLDGINEKGVGIAVLTLDCEPVAQNTGKQVLSTPILMRLVLDRAASTAEAVALLENYDMYATNGRDYHFYITDASGDGRIVEFDPESETRQMIVTPIRSITNFFPGYSDKVEPNQKNGIYGHGKERWLSIEAVFDAHNGIADNAVAWEALKSAAQEPNPESITSNTQWSIVYNLTDLSYELAFRRNWDNILSLKLE